MAGKQPLMSVDLSVDYPNKPRTLRGVRFDVHHGEIVGVVGESGSGKSTLALALMRLLDLKDGKASGSLMFRERDLMTASEKDMRMLRGREIALVLQSP